MEAGSDGLAAPLLRTGASKKKPLEPLYFLTLLSAIAYCIARLPALSLRFQELAVDAGLDTASAAAAFGRVTALRSIVEFFCTPAIASWSDRVGRRRAICLCTAAFCIECALLAGTRSLLALSAVHVLSGLLADSNGALEHSCIADATPRSQRAVAFGRLLTVVGVAMILGPMLGGELAARRGLGAPFVAAAALCFLGVVFAVLCLPEYLPPGSRTARPTGAGAGAGLRDFAALLRGAPSLSWYMAASALANFGLGAYSSVQAFWAREALGWGPRDLGRFMSFTGIFMVISQGVMLPLLRKVARDREGCLAQGCLVLNAAKVAAYGLAPHGGWVYAFTVFGAAGSCGNTVLRSLLSSCAGEKQQGLLSGGTSALGAAAQTLGAVTGSQVLAAALRRGAPSGIPMLLSAVAFLLAAACIARAPAAAGERKRQSEDEVAAKKPGDVEDGVPSEAKGS